MLAEGYFLAGEYDKARQTADEAVQLAERHGAKPFLGWSSRLLGEIVLATNPEEAAPHFEKAISVCREIKAENDLALAYSGMGRYHKHQGNTAQAREYLTKALQIFDRLGTLIEPDKVSKELAELDE
jgi:tetratricopeptide (TPR) repeat protein